MNTRTSVLAFSTGPPYVTWPSGFMTTVVPYSWDPRAVELIDEVGRLISGPVAWFSFRLPTFCSSLSPSNSAIGSIRCPLGDNTNWKDSVPSGRLSVTSPGPHRCNFSEIISRIARSFRKECNPRSGGMLLPGTTGAV